MTSIKIVKTAKIECIKPHKLKVGDYILWSSFKCKVIEIYTLNRFDNAFALIEQFPNEPESRLEIPKYSAFYKIKDCKLVEEEID